VGKIKSMVVIKKVWERQLFNEEKKTHARWCTLLLPCFPFC